MVVVVESLPLGDSTLTSTTREEEEERPRASPTLLAKRAGLAGRRVLLGPLPRDFGPGVVYRKARAVAGALAAGDGVLRDGGEAVVVGGRCLAAVVGGCVVVAVVVVEGIDCVVVVVVMVVEGGGCSVVVVVVVEAGCRLPSPCVALAVVPLPSSYSSAKS